MFNFDSGRYAAKVAEYLEQHFVPQFTTSRDLFAALYTRKAIRGAAALLVAGVGVNRNPTVAGVSNPYNAVTVGVETNVTPNYFWSHYFGMTLVSYEELKISTSEGAVLDILEERLNNTMESFYELVADHLISSTAASKDRVNGIGYMLAATGSFGGIDRANNTWWRALNNINEGTFTLQKLNRRYNQIKSQGGTPPTIIVMPEDLFSAYEALVIASQRFLKDQKMAELGFDNYLHKGAVVLYDSRMPAGEIWFLNTRYCYLTCATAQPDTQPAQFPDRPASGYVHNWLVQWVATRLNAHARTIGWTV